MNETNFLQNSSLGIQYTYSIEFFLGQSTYETHFDIVWSSTVYLISSTYPKIQE